jgi:polysaccharide export outer membrane protein
MWLFKKRRSLLRAVALILVLAGFGRTPLKAQDSYPAYSAAGPYVLGPGDLITVWALGADEMSGKAYAVPPGGVVDFPLAGRIRAAGRTPDQLKAELIEKMKTYVRQPEVSVSITEFRSQPVSVLGSVKQPGVHQLQGGKSLLEVISLAGGLAPDASNTAVITRRSEWGKIPVPDATQDASGKFSIARINLNQLAEAKDPQNNIQICPNDVIEVPRARLVYVMGQVTKPGGYVLNADETVSALQALSMAGGPSQFGSLKNARILRPVQGSTERQQIAVNLSNVMEGKSSDSVLKPDDILYVPGNLGKNASLRALEAGLQIGTGLIIWR